MYVELISCFYADYVLCLIPFIVLCLPTLLSLLAKEFSRQSSSPLHLHIKHKILQSFISSQLTGEFCHDSQKTSMPPIADSTSLLILH